MMAVERSTEDKSRSKHGEAHRRAACSPRAPPPPAQTAASSPPPSHSFPPFSALSSALRCCWRPTTARIVGMSRGVGRRWRRAGRKNLTSKWRQNGVKMCQKIAKFTWSCSSISCLWLDLSLSTSSAALACVDASSCRKYVRFNQIKSD